MMGMMGNSRKGLASVLLNNKLEATENPELDPQAINPDQGMMDACSELLKAIDKKDATRMVRCFKAIFTEMKSQDEMEEGDDSQEY